MQNITETNAIKTDNGLLFKTEEHYLITEFTANKDAWYDLEIKYSHDDWEAYVRVDITYPTGEVCGFMQGLLHGRKVMVFPVYLKTGANKIKFRHHYTDNTEIFGINLKGK